MNTIQDMFEDGKPGIFFKTVKGFDIKSTILLILASEQV